MKRTGPIIMVLGFLVFVPLVRADWTSVKRLTWNPGDSEFPAVAKDSNDTIHVVWSDDTPYAQLNNAELYYRRSPDGGTTWSAAKRLTWTFSDSDQPVIAVDANNIIHIVWSEYTPSFGYEIYHKRSLDGGTTWSAAKRLTWNSGYSILPAMAIDSKNAIHIVWHDDTPGLTDIYYKKSADEGQTWSAAKRLTWTSSSSLYPGIAVDASDAIHVFWSESVPDNSNSDIHYKRSTDGGVNWTAAQRLSWTTGHSMELATAIDSQKVIHVVWYEYTTGGNEEILYKRGADGGTDWGATKRLVWSSGFSNDPAMAVDANDGIHVVWAEYYEISYLRSTDGGSGWTAPKRLTWTSGYSCRPALVTDSNSTIHLVWQDNTPGDYEIYYRNGK
jgi:BNR repeat-containing family member